MRTKRDDDEENFDDEILFKELQDKLDEITAKNVRSRLVLTHESVFFVSKLFYFLFNQLRILHNAFDLQAVKWATFRTFLALKKI